MEHAQTGGKAGARPRWSAFLLLLLPFIPQVAPEALVAQDVPSAPSSPDSGSVTQRAPTDRSPLGAALLQAALPPLPLGYAYAGDLSRSLLPTGLMVGGSLIFLLETVELIDWTDEDKGSPALFYVGLGALTVGYVYGVIDAYDATKDENARRRSERVTWSIDPMERGVGLSARVPAL